MKKAAEGSVIPRMWTEAGSARSHSVAEKTAAFFPDRRRDIQKIGMALARLSKTDTVRVA